MVLPATDELELVVNCGGSLVISNVNTELRNLTLNWEGGHEFKLTLFIFLLISKLGGY